jgi:hypothetical protein
MSDGITDSNRGTLFSGYDYEKTRREPSEPKKEKPEPVSDNPVNIEITGVTVLLGPSTDEVVLHTKLPSGVWPFEGTTRLKFEVAKSKGIQYVEDNFDMDPKIINMRV